MAKVLVLYYSTYGHIETMANAIAEGAKSAGAEVDIKRVPETVPEEIAKGAHFKLDQAAPVASVADLEKYDAIIVGTGTRFGRMSSQMAAFFDAAGGLWARGALNGKVGAAFVSTASQHGGQETTLFSVITNLLHFGLTIVGLDYGYGAQGRIDEMTAELRRLVRRGEAQRDAVTLAGILALVAQALALLTVGMPLLRGSWAEAPVWLLAGIFMQTLALTLFVIAGRRG